MKKGKYRKLLEENLIEVLNSSKLKANEQKVKDIKSELLNKHDMMNVQSILNNPEEKIPDLDIRELMLFSEQVFFKTGDFSINPEDYFRPAEIKESRQFSATTQSTNKLQYPIMFENVSFIGNSMYSFVLDSQTIDELMESEIFYYDPELQREAEKIKRTNVTITQPKLYMRNVKEITEHLLKGTLFPTELVFNAMPRTSVSGTELIYDASKRTLEVTNGTKIAIVDGFHRITAVRNALLSNPDLKFNFTIKLMNLSKKDAQKYQAQFAKGTPISKVRIKEMEETRLADTVAISVRNNSDLEGRVSQQSNLYTSHGELVTYDILSDTIDEEFTLKTRLDVDDVTEYLIDYFNYLLASHSEEFLFNPNQYRNRTLINSNIMFVGYITLARRMFELGIKPRKIINIIDKIDFNRDNPLWEKINLLDEKGNFTNNTHTKKVKDAIKDVFENIDLNGDVIKT